MIKVYYEKYRNIYTRLYTRVSHLLTSFALRINSVEHSKFTSIGIPLLDIHPEGRCKFGSDLIMINSERFSMLGKTNKCKITVSAGANLFIGNKVGMSNTIIIATASITIGNNILIGGGATIVDTDFHSLNPADWHTDEDQINMRSSPVQIGDNVFIGMNAIILKGVKIGSGVIIAAGSVVSKDIPDNEIWGGNPAKFMKSNEIKS